MGTIESRRPLQPALVIGSRGFLGSAILTEFRRRAVPVLTLDRGSPSVEPDLVEALSGSVTVDSSALRAAVARVEGGPIVLAAGSGSVPRSLEDPVGDQTDNAGTALAVLEAVRRASSPSHVVVVSSAAVYGEAVRLPIDEGHPRVPRSPYGVSKLAAEEYARVYCELFGVRTSVVRPFSVYGPAQRKLVVYDLLRRAMSGESPMEIAAPARVTRDFVFIDDVARAVVTVAERATGDGIAYNVCSGQPTSLEQLVAEIFACVAPDAEAVFTGRIRLGDPVHWVGDGTRLAGLGETPSTSLHVGLRVVADAMTSL